VRRVLVTGGSGFIGTNLVERLRRDGSTEVRNYDLRAPRCAAHAGLWTVGDIDTTETLAAVMEDFEPTHLVHLAARTDLRGDAMDDYRTNTHGVRVVLEASTSYGRLRRSIFASSRLVCDLGVTPTSEYDYAPPNCYGRSKVVGEQLVRAHHHAGEWIIVRPTSIWGPWGAEPYRDFFLSLARGRYVHPSREAVRKHYGYVGNVAHQIDRLLDAPSDRVQGRTLYLADPEPVDVLAFATAIRRSMGLPPPRSVPVPVLRLAAAVGDLLRASGVADPPLTSDRLGNLRTTMLFDLEEVDEIVGPLPYDLQEGIDRTVAHLWRQDELPQLEGARSTGIRIYDVPDPPFE
jgi:GlcNAc-P-P-Und epimerase